MCEFYSHLGDGKNRFPNTLSLWENKELKLFPGEFEN